MAAYGISREFTEASDGQLDESVKAYKQQNPSAGLRFVMAHLRTGNLRVQRDRVIQSVRRVDGLGTKLRQKQTVKRRVYFVPRPNHLWHMDGHHKLIRWGIVVHGIIDGYCRTVGGFTEIIPT